MTRDRKHTWKMVYFYHRCPNCGYIQLDRTDYSISQQKTIYCARCKKEYILQGSPTKEPDNEFYL